MVRKTIEYQKLIKYNYNSILSNQWEIIPSFLKNLQSKDQ
jgi:hypothetical protein